MDSRESPRFSGFFRFWICSTLCPPAGSAHRWALAWIGVQLEEKMFSDEELLTRFGKSRDELICIADAHTLDVQAWLSSRSPCADHFSGKGIHASSTGIKVPLLNLALGYSFPEGTSEATIEAEVRAVKDFLPIAMCHGIGG